jgi:hypothetical protein
MRRNWIVIALLFAAVGTFVWAQTSPQVTPAPNPSTTPPTQSAPSATGAMGAETNPVTQDMSWMIGEWQGTGTENGKTYQSTLSVHPQLDGQALLLERSTPTGYKELTVIAYDKTSQKTVSTIFTSQNNSGIFIANVQPDQITFTQVGAAQGSTSERVYQRTADGKLNMIIRGASNGEQPKTLLEMSFTKTS